MKHVLPLLLATLSPLALSAAPALAATAATSAEQLKKLFADSDEAALKRNPIQAMFRGDLRYADRLGDYVSDDYYRLERAASEADLRGLKAINRASLSPTDRIAYDVFEWQTRLNLRGYAQDILALTAVRPIDHFSGFQTFYPDFASGQGAAPFKTLLDYDNNLKRHADYVILLDRAIGRFREGMKTGVVQPKLVVNNVIDQLNTQIAQGVEGSPLFGPTKVFPKEISATDQARLKIAYTAAIRDQLIPAYIRLRDYLKNDYLPKSREGVGLSAMKGGAKLYAYDIEFNTTVAMTAEQVHKLGLSEVARVLKGMDAIRVETGFKGSLGDFFNYFRDDPKFKFATKEAMQSEFVSIGQTVDAHIREQFSTIPKTPLEIRAVPDYLEKTSAGAYYNQGAPDGSRPGIFYFNTYDLPARSKPGSDTLYLHEAVPGHHFQISLAQENDSLPAFMRFGGNTAYVEGWALYAESLFKEMGVENDPYTRFGGLNDEMLRAMRLVVDSGLHAKGWGRDKAIKYMLDNSGMSRTDATAEVERYIAIPGQALAYKVGQLTILRLKAKAQAALGAKFDPRAFHAQILNTGALPMAVLEKKIGDWIAAGGK